MKVSDKLAKEFCIFQSVPESQKSEHYKNILPYFLWLLGASMLSLNYLSVYKNTINFSQSFCSKWLRSTTENDEKEAKKESEYSWNK